MKINQILEGKTEKVTPPKPRNFVAKNAIQSGAGAHKDKKKAAKQGDVKHKTQALAESYSYEEIAQKVYNDNPNLPTSGRGDEFFNAAWPYIVELAGNKKRANYMLNYDEDFPSDLISAYADLQRQSQTEGIGDAISSVATKVGDALSTALPQEYRPFDNQTAANNTAKYKQAQTKESFNGEYDDEVGMAENQLQTIQRCAREMEENLVDGENLPEWVQSKITIAKENIVTAFDYILSQHQNGELEMSEERESKLYEPIALTKATAADNANDTSRINTDTNWDDIDPEDHYWNPDLPDDAETIKSLDVMRDRDVNGKATSEFDQYRYSRKNDGTPGTWTQNGQKINGRPNITSMFGRKVMEVSRNPDTMSATDYDRYQQGQMDSEKRNFKRDEMEQELGDENRGMYFVVIAKNGKWEHTKAQPRQEGMNASQKVINALHAKYPNMHLGMVGPDGKVYNMGKGK
jgi:hypothetical protein